MQTTIPVLGKAIDAIEWIASRRDGPTSRDVAEALGIAPTTCYRILQVFQHRGWLRPSAGGRYAPGWGLMPLVQGLTSHPLLGVEAGVALQTLARRVGHTVKISVRERFDSVTLRGEEAPVPYALSTRPGTRFPVVVGASGAVLLAQGADDEDAAVAAALKHAPAEAWTYQTRATVERRVRRARADGWCLDDGSYRPDLFGLSVPLAAAGLGAAAALTITGLSHGLRAAQIKAWLAPLRATAAALEGLAR